MLQATTELGLLQAAAHRACHHSDAVWAGPASSEANACAPAIDRLNHGQIDVSD